MAEEYLYELKIPKERVAVLIGKKGETKKDLESATRSRFEIDSKEGDVRIKSKDPLGMLMARDIVKAIGRGFNPDVAMLILKQDYCLEILNLPDYLGKTKNKLARLKARVIGTEGKARKNIEQLTDTYISIYGKTIAIIGQPQNASTARRAIESLVGGSNHATVWRWLERKRKEMRVTEDVELKEGVEIKE